MIVGMLAGRRLGRVRLIRRYRLPLVRGIGGFGVDNEGMR